MEERGELRGGLGIFLGQKKRRHREDSAGEGEKTEGEILKRGGKGLAEGKSVNGVGGTKTVVDIDHGNARGAGVEHAKESGNSLEVGAIANRGRNGNEGGTNESTENAREGCLHAGDNEEGVVLAQSIKMLKGAMEAGDANVIKAGRAVS